MYCDMEGSKGVGRRERSIMLPNVASGRLVFRIGILSPNVITSDWTTAHCDGTQNVSGAFGLSELLRAKMFRISKRFD
jgi:hypothetical protein